MVIHARIGYDGQEAYGFTIAWSGACPKSVGIEGNVRDTRRDQKLAELDGRKERGIQKTEVKGPVTDDIGAVAEFLFCVVGPA